MITIIDITDKDLCPKTIWWSCTKEGHQYSTHRFECPICFIDSIVGRKIIQGFGYLRFEKCNYQPKPPHDDEQYKYVLISHCGHNMGYWSTAEKLLDYLIGTNQVVVDNGNYKLLDEDKLNILLEDLLKDGE